MLHPHLHWIQSESWTVQKSSTYRAMGWRTCSFIISLNLIILWTISSASVKPSPIVPVTGGLIQGGMEEIQKVKVFFYLGIPFAEPPVGPLRFTYPKDPKPWKGVRNTTQHAPKCLQELVNDDDDDDESPPLRISEDCLYLDVYTPELNTDLHNYNPLPVIVCIHGDRLITGSSSDFQGYLMVSLHRVVVVSIQYRLGIAGFLSTGDKWAEGNFGMVDQLAALLWVQKNIERFAGDMESVTLFGQFSGAISSSLFALLPMTSSLFHRVIIEGGSALIPGIITPNKTQLAHEASQIGNCNTRNSMEILSCLRNKTEDEMRTIIINVNKKYQVIPVVMDGKVIVDDPRRILADRHFRRIWYLIGLDTYGVVDHIIHTYVLPEWLQGISKETAMGFINKHLTPLFGVKSAEKIFKEYFTNVTHPLSILDNLIEMTTDALVIIPLIQTAQFLRVYTRLPFVFGGNIKPDIKTTLGSMAGERRLYNLMMKHWINFALDGDPNSPDLSYWPSFDAKEQYKLFNLTISVRQRFRQYRMDFWSKVIPRNVTIILIL
ncbi:pyrethroid hydrolase Ces2e isoform X2 [Callorhinchus milii]|uniref:pyrethroid hydrolase Ces2e isoform X2 n=1 Tax=Callorhinchus milii TaxID=7868 RepID=UPI0004572B53|nr:pyrethroid hydrolase Ces2e isoform X2 [Callorhinchus milii]|eukprot:gi/632978724/ref/XP_007906075.1/ PREDICTED: pyrethroid hydrolase Ces2e-like isoform X2 [Callorhinchus milii]